MALRNRKEVETLRVFGVNLADNDNELEFGWFTSLQNWVPGEFYSLKKKRGVTSVEGGATSFAVTDPC